MSRATPEQAENAELLDRTLNLILKEGGEPLVDANGTVQLDKEGRVIRRRPSAATLNVIRGRIKDLGINSLPVRGSASGDLLETAKEHGLKIDGRPIDPFGKLPPVDVEEEDAATG